MVATRSKTAVQQEAPLTHVLDRLRGSRPYSRGYTAHCPGSVHRNGDSKPSLMLWENEDGSVGLKCFAGCTRKDICTSLGITEQDLYPRNDTYRPKRVARSLDLTDLCLDKHIDPRLLNALGVVDGYTWQAPKGKRCKNIVRIPYHNLDGSEYSRAHLRFAVKGHGPWEGTGDLIPYGLDRLKDATDSLVIVEGESDCWTLWQWNIPALGIPGASNTQSLRAEHIEHFPGRVYIVKENPPAGPKFVKSIASKLHTCGYQGEILQLDLQASHQLEDPNDLNKLLFEENRPRDFLTEWQKVLDAALLLDPAILASPSSKRKRSAGSQPPKDSGSEETSEEESEYIELVEGYYCTEERDKLYKQVIERDPESRTIIDTRFDPVRLQRAGMPRLLDVYNVEGKSDGYLSDETFYHIEWSGRSQQGPHWFTENELNRREWFSKFPGIPATKRSTRDHYADVVKSQVDAFGIPVGLARRSTGWHKAGERWEYYWS